MFCSKHAITFGNMHLLRCWFHYVGKFYIKYRFCETYTVTSSVTRNLLIETLSNFRTNECWFTSLLNYVPYVPYLLSCLTCLIPYIFSCLACFVPYVPSCLTYLVPYELSCLTCYTWFNLKWLNNVFQLGVKRIR